MTVKEQDEAVKACEKALSLHKDSSLIVWYGSKGDTACLLYTSWGAVLVISAVSATFFGDFSGCFAGFGELFCGFQQFQLLFSRIFPAVSLWLGLSLIHI